MSWKNYLSLLMGIGLLACQNEKESTDDGIEEGVVTYVNISVHLPGMNPTKALPQDYNPDGVYEGNDGVETLDVYMLSSGGVVEAKRFANVGLSTNGSIISPSEPFRTTSGTKTVYVVVNSPAPLDTQITNDSELIAIAGLAQIVTENGVDYDVITMTGKATSVVIEPDISQQQVTAGQNHISIDVERMASRVIVTTTADDTITDENGATIGTISNVTYSVAQGTTQIYFIRQSDYTTFGSSYVPAIGEYVGQAQQYYDYSDLSTPLPVPARPAAGDGYKSLLGKFLFENTHTEGDIRTTGYRKGNTAYVLVRGTFTPATSAIADGGDLTAGTFYVGQADGLIYSTKQAAQAAVQNQRVATYQNGKMLYYAWLNPDDINAPLNSPVIRNNIYHINITGFGRIGYNWNPLYPEDPDTATPENPDPKPINPDEPEPPVDPIDPLTPEQTYMTVEVTALDWTVHSYDIEL